MAGGRDLIDGQLTKMWAAQKITPVEQATDSTFLRRAYLDLVGTLPTYDETQAFLKDDSPNKRGQLIDRLLNDPRFALAQTDFWNLVLFGRHPANGEYMGKRETFREWLGKQISTDAPMNDWTKRLLLGEETGTELYHVQFRNQPEEATVNISKVFLGTQLQCARCHDHPYDKWTQKDFYGMTGFFVRLVVQEQSMGNKRTFTLGEKSTGEVLFSGNAKDQAPGKKGEPVAPKFLGGSLLNEPKPPANADKTPPPKGNEKLPKPAYSRKEQLANWVAATDNPYFAKAMVNRVWAKYMGRGIVHPVDDFHADNEPSPPGLLDELTAEFVKQKMSLKWLTREIVNTKAYQLASTGPNKEALPKKFERARIRPLTYEEIVAGMRLVTGYDTDKKPGEGIPNSGNEYFLRYFGEPTNGLGDFQGSLQEHLFVNNSDQVRTLIRRKKGNLVDVLATHNGPPEEIVKRLYLSVLQRTPNSTETEAFVKYLSIKEKNDSRLEEAVWVLLASSEFRFNH